MPPKTLPGDGGNGGPPAKGKGKGLGKKIGPFPLWLWLGAGAGLAIVAYMYLRKTGEGSDELYGPVETVTGSSPMDQAYSGAPAENGALGTQLTPEVQDALSRAEGMYSYSYEELRGQIKDIEDALEASGWIFEGPGDAYPEGAIIPPSKPSEAVIDATLGAPGGAPRPASNKPKPKPKPPKAVSPKKPPKKKPPAKKPPAAKKPPKKAPPPPRKPPKPAPVRKPPKAQPKKKPPVRKPPVRRGGGPGSARAM